MEHIGIIGGGIAGLSAAIRLAAAGKPVTVFEQNQDVGGKMHQIQSGGYRWDTGPSVITMRHVFESLFAAAGRKIDDYLTLLPVEPLTRYFYPDGTVLDASRDLARMAEQIARIGGERDVEGYLAYLAYAARIHRVTGGKFIYNDPPTFGQLARTPIRDIPAVDPLRTMSGAINSFVKSPKLRQLLGRFATYVGASPYLAPATLNVIAHVELTGGVWYPQGGVYQIAAAFKRLALELGVELRTETRVESIRVKDGVVQGVMLASGEFVALDAVIANTDVASVYETLLPHLPAAEKTRRARVDPSCSGFILLLGVENVHERLAHHNIFFSDDYRREFDDIFVRELPPDDPTIYVAITSKTDPDHAPSGCENWFVLVNAPALSVNGRGASAAWWESHAAAYADRVLERLAAHGVDVRGKIQHQQIITPHDLERLTGARRGALYGASSNDRLSALRRPHNRASGIKRLYFAGGTTHPGGGVPMVTLSGAVAARYVLQDLGGI